MMRVLSTDGDFLRVVRTKLFKDLYFWWPINLDYHINSGGDWRVEVIIGAILTQNTKWNNVELALKNLFDNKIVFTIEEFSKIDENKLRSLIKPVSFYNVKAKRIVDIFKEIDESFGDINSMKSLSIGYLREFLLSLKGIGRETADVILLYALEKPIFVVDSYTFKFTNLYLNLDFNKYDDLRLFYEKSVKKYLNNISELIISVLNKINCREYIKKYFNYSFDNLVQLPLNPCMLTKNIRKQEVLTIIFKELHAQIDIHMKNLKKKEK